MKEVNVKLSIGPSDQLDENTGKEFQGIHASFPPGITSIWVTQESWDKLSSDKKEDALALFTGGWNSALHTWVNDCVDTVDILAGLKTVEGVKNDTT